MFKITIEETKMVKKIVGKDWNILEEKDGEKKRGYTPEIEKEVEKNDIIYTQIVDKINLVAVINAVNEVIS